MSKAKFSINPLGGEVEKGEVKFHSFVQEPGKSFLPSCVAPVRLDLTNSTVLNSVSNAEVLDVPMESVFPHPVTEVTYKPKNLRYLMLTLQVAGQLEEIDAIKVEDQFFIVDGMSRYIAAQQLGFESIRVRVLDLTEKEVKALRAHKNIRAKRPLSEQLEMVNLMLESYGSSQGKKRNLEEVIQICDTVESEKVLSDRFEIVKSALDLDMSAGSLRKAVKVFQFVAEGPEEVKNLGLLEKMDAGDMSIDAAFNLMKTFKRSDEERKKPNALEEIKIHGKKNWFKLFNKTCEDLSDLEDKSIQTVIFSPPYWRQRIYPEGVNLEGLKFGEEPTVDLYVENSIKIYTNLKRILKESGSVFINISESYSEGDCASIISRLIIAMEKDGWHLKQVTIWKKLNAKPVGGKIKRLRPSTEVILHFTLNKNNHFYRPFRLWDKSAPITIQGGCNDEIDGDKKQKKKKYSLNRPVISFTDFLDEQVVAGVISGSIVNKSQLKKIDSEFNHIAPAPEYISVIPILTTTVPGSTVLEICCGTSSLLAFALRSGRNVIGYDTDPRSIEFSKKHLQSILDDQFSDSEIEEIQTNYLIAA
uniref:DNA methyltransferase n=1 Tax=Algoriphagus sp. TaxID=1872435 RepID=UPI004048421F